MTRQSDDDVPDEDGQGDDTVDRLVGELRDLRVRAGVLPYAEIARRIGAEEDGAHTSILDKLVTGFVALAVIQLCTRRLRAVDPAFSTPMDDVFRFDPGLPGRALLRSRPFVRSVARTRLA